MLNFVLLLYLLTTPITPSGLKVGDKAPSFTATDQFGKQISLDESLSNGKVILTFYRGAWCRYCMKQFRNYQDSLALIEAKGATLIAITPEHEEGVEKTTRVSGASFSILHDEKLAIMKSYRVITEEKVAEYRSEMARTGVDNQEKYLPVPATFIINQQGIIEFVYFDPNYRVRVPIDILLEHL
jgi:peroxiredoxin